MIDFTVAADPEGGNGAEEPAVLIQECPHCQTRVIATSGGSCPACRRDWATGRVSFDGGNVPHAENSAARKSPWTVRTASLLLNLNVVGSSLSLTASFAMTAYSVRSLPAAGEGVASFAALLLLAQAMSSIAAVAIWAWLTSKISAGRNWARRVFGVWSLLGWGFACLALGRSRHEIAAQFRDNARIATVAAAVSVACTLMQLSALMLLFAKPSRPWFQPER